jgi:hypothetical protein
MSEMNERRWAVISERGREASGLEYAEAGELVQRLRGEKISGLCVITDAAAGRLPPAKKGGKRGRAGESTRQTKRGAKKRAT